MLSQAAEDGHCFLPEQELVERTTKQLALPDYPVTRSYQSLIVQMTQDKQLTPKRIWRSQRATDLLHSGVLPTPKRHWPDGSLFCQHASGGRASRVSRWIVLHAEKGITLSEEQRPSR